MSDKIAVITSVDGVLHINPDNSEARLKEAFTPIGHVCPKCGGKNTDGDLGVMGPGGSVFEWYCVDCEHTWLEHGELTGVVYRFDDRDS